MTLVVEHARVNTEANGFGSKSSYQRGELLACAHGEWPAGVPRLPAPPFLMFNRIVEISKTGGKFGGGFLIAELDIKPDLPFFECHFVGDPVMPGCLQLDALWQGTGFFAGCSGARGRGRATGVGSVKFTGEILPSARLVQYRIDIKRLAVGKKSFAVGDGTVTCDGKVVCTATDLTAFIIS